MIEWIDYSKQQPEDGQNCLVVFEHVDGNDSHRWMAIDVFTEGWFDFLANWEDQCNSVALPTGSTIAKYKAVCWSPTELSNKPLTFDEFWEEKEEG